MTRYIWTLTVLAAIAVGFTFTGCGEPQAAAPPAPATTPATQPAAAATDDYPVDYCVVSDEALDVIGNPISYMHEGREVRFCCSPCIKKFKADPAKYLARLDAAARGEPAQHKGHDHSGHEH